MGSPIRALGYRLYADFLMPSRLETLRRTLAQAREAGYEIVSIEAFWERINGTGIGRGRYLVLRHDVDTDPGTAREMWTIERSVGAHGSFFFRLSTLDVPLMRAIAASGSGVGYHYEEIAALVKRLGLRTRREAEDHMGEARADFLRNISKLRAMTGLPLSVVASHGDFMNRRLGMPNWELLADDAIRLQAGIEMEAYDAAMMRWVNSRHSDTLHPRYWIPAAPDEALARGDQVVYLLIHPRHWRTARAINARDDALRLWEGIGHRWRGVRLRGREARHG